MPKQKASSRRDSPTRATIVRNDAVGPIVDGSANNEMTELVSNIYTVVPSDSQRPCLWLYACNVETKKREHASDFYQNLASIEEKTEATAQITLDLDRTLTDNKAFLDIEQRTSKLFEILKAYAFYNGGLGYCQGMSCVVAALMTEIKNNDDIFWILVEIMERCGMKDYYSKKMEGLLKDANTFYFILKKLDAALVEHLDRYSLNVLMFITPWYLSLFTCMPNWSVVLRIFDCFIVEGPKALHRISLAILAQIRDHLLTLKGIEQLLPYVLNLPDTALDAATLFPAAAKYDFEALEKEALEDIMKSNSGGVAEALKVDKKSVATFSITSQSTQVTQTVTAMPGSQTPSKQFPFMRWMQFDVTKMLLGGDEETTMQGKAHRSENERELAASAPAMSRQQANGEEQQSSGFSFSRILNTLTPVKRKTTATPTASPSPYFSSRFIYGSSNSQGISTPQMQRDPSSPFNSKVRAAIQSPKYKQNSLRRKGRNLSTRNLLQKNLSNRNNKKAMTVNTKDKDVVVRPIKRKTKEDDDEEEEEDEEEDVAPSTKYQEGEEAKEEKEKQHKQTKEERAPSQETTTPNTPSRKRKKAEEEEPTPGKSGKKSGTPAKKRKSVNLRESIASRILSGNINSNANTDNININNNDDDSFLSSTDEGRSPFKIRKFRGRSLGKSQPVKQRQRGDCDSLAQKENKTPSVSHTKKLISAQEEESQSLKAFTTPLKERTPHGSSKNNNKSGGSSSKKPLTGGGGLYLLSPYYFSPSRSARVSARADESFEMSDF